MSERLVDAIGLEFFPEYNPETRVRESTYAYLKLIHFLGNPLTFPNTNVNQLIRFQSEMIKCGIPTIIVRSGKESEEGNIQLFVEKEKDNIEEESAIFIDGSLAYQAADDPIKFLVATTAVASLSRDYWTGRLKDDHIDNVTARAGAYSADALITIGDIMATLEEDWNMSDDHRTFLDQYPSGINSLSSGVNYTSRFFGEPNTWKNN